MQVFSNKTLPFIYRSMHRFGSYYQTVRMFSEVEETAGSKDKLAKIRQFKKALSQTDQKQFYNLLQWYSKDESVRITSKIINKYYLNNYVATAHHTLVQAEVNKDGVMKKLCKDDRQSELTLFDVNLFLRYLCSVQGKGSQTEKIKKVLEFGENVSILEGSFFLKLIEKRLTIGASNKTFRKMDLQQQSADQKPKKERKPRKKKEEKSQQTEKQQKKQQAFQVQTASEEQIMKRFRQKQSKILKSK